MFNIMNFFKQKQVVVREGVLDQVTEILFPAPEENEVDGLTMIVDRSIDSNLQAALIDLEEGVNDKVTRETIQKCIIKLIEARELLLAEYPINKKAHYLMVDAPKGTSNVTVD